MVVSTCKANIQHPFGIQYSVVVTYVELNSKNNFVFAKAIFSKRNNDLKLIH